MRREAPAVVKLSCGWEPDPAPSAGKSVAHARGENGEPVFAIKKRKPDDKGYDDERTDDMVGDKCHDI